MLMDTFEDVWPSGWPGEARLQAVENELRQIALDYISRARTIVASGTATIYRAIRIPCVGGLHNINWDCLGKSWSAEYRGADVYGMAPLESDCYRDVVLVGNVEAQYIDWKFGFESFAIYGKDQWEISLLPYAPVLIHTVVVRPAVEGLSPDSSPYDIYKHSLPPDRREEQRVLSKPILGSTGPAQEVWEESCKEVRGRPRMLVPGEAALEGYRWWK